VSDSLSRPPEVSGGVEAFARHVAIGLTDTPRWLSCQYLYDARGSELFEQITRLPEYYPTRTEAGILQSAARDIAELTGDVTLIELGSGSSEKTGYLLSAYTGAYGAAQYVPVDVSKAAIRHARARLENAHPAVRVSPVICEYEEAFPLFRAHAPSMVMFLGSTIGNFNNGESLRFWRSVSEHLGSRDHFLLGVDLVKDRAVLEAAYNDSAGVTAEFTKNLFVRMNRELDAGIDVSEVEHVARYTDEWQRIEIFALFHTKQTIRIAPLDTEVVIGAGERVMIEISRKFVIDHLAKYLSVFGFEVRQVFTDENRWFAVLLLRRVRPLATVRSAR
jgi:L-histidine N-alpha-methyltransferase